MITDNTLSFLRRKAYPTYAVNSAKDIPVQDHRLIGSVLDSLGREGLEEILSILGSDPAAPSLLINDIRWRVTRTSPAPAPQRHNEPISRLLCWYADKKSRKVSYSTSELKRRFSGQSYSVQNMILKAFLQGGRKEVEWAGRFLRDNWIPSFAELVLKRWKETGLSLLAYVILRHLPDEVILREQEELARDAGYLHVCARIGNAEGFLMDENRLDVPGWFHVMAQLRRRDAVSKMDARVDEYLLTLMDSDVFLLYDDSLLSFQPLRTIVRAMKVLNYTDGILRLSQMWDHALDFSYREQGNEARNFALIFSLRQQATNGLEDDITYQEAKEKRNENASITTFAFTCPPNDLKDLPF